MHLVTDPCVELHGQRISSSQQFQTLGRNLFRRPKIYKYPFSGRGGIRFQQLPALNKTKIKIYFLLYRKEMHALISPIPSVKYCQIDDAVLIQTDRIDHAQIVDRHRITCSRFDIDYLARRSPTVAIVGVSFDVWSDTPLIRGIFPRRAVMKDRPKPVRAIVP